LATTSSGTNKRATRLGVGGAVALLLAGLIITALAARFTKSEVDAVAKREFDFVCNEIQAKIQDRLKAHEQILRSGAAFYEASENVTRAEWHCFTERQKLEQQLPGVQGIGFALLIPSQQLARHVQAIRAEGFPEYHIQPEGQRETYSSIIYLEPFADRNLRAFGYDMLTEPIRREAMERARDQDAAVLSGKVVLVQETNQDVQAGTLMYMPVYRAGMPHKTIIQRRAAILGWVYSPYRMNDLMQGVLGGWDSKDNNRFHLEIFDGERVSPETLLYDSLSAGGNERVHTSALMLKTPIDSAGRRWTLCFPQSGSVANAVDYSKVWFALLGGTSISLLLFGLSLSRLNTKIKAWQIARKLTAEYKQIEEMLRQTTDRLSLAARAGGVGIWDYDVASNRLIWDDQMFCLYGITREQFGGAYEAWQAGVHPEDRQRGDEEIQFALRGEKDFNTEFRVAWPDGSIHYIRALAVVQRNAAGQPLHMIGTNWSITHQKQIEGELRESHNSLEKRVHERTTELSTINKALSAENDLRREAEALLEEHQHNLRRLASQLTLAEEAQRHELAVQLHDTIGQELAMARLRLEYARGTPTHERERHFDVAAELLDAAIGQVHTLTHGLGAGVLYQLGLPAALRSIGSQVSTQHDLQFTFHQVGDYRRSSQELEVHAFRTVRELVYNVVKHAHASQLDIHLTAAADTLVIRVEDDGCGFLSEAGLKNNSNRGSGFGLFSIRERLAILGGRLELQSSPGQGTIALVTIPLPDGPPAATENGQNL